MIAEREWSKGDLVPRYHQAGGIFPDEVWDGCFYPTRWEVVGSMHPSFSTRRRYA